jgi:hypothetical protein
MHHEAVPTETRPPRELELAERRHVRADSLLAEDAQQRDVRERLRPVDDERAGRRPREEPRSLAQRLLAVNEERRAERLCQRRGADPADGQLAFPNCRCGGKQC